MNLSFSTRGWPEMSWDDMMDTALDMGFTGIEVYNLPKFDALTDRGGPFHSLLLMPLNFGNNYMKLIAKTLGFSDYFALPVDGTGSTLPETHAAMDKARALIPETVEKVAQVK